MKKNFKRMLALLMAVALVATGAVYSSGTALKATGGDENISQDEAGTRPDAANGGNGSLSQDAGPQAAGTQAAGGAAAQPKTNVQEIEVPDRARETPEQNTPDQNTPGQNTPGQNTPGQNTPDQNTPDQNTPDQNTPDQNVPGQNTPDQNTPGQNAPEQNTPDQNVPDSNVQNDRPADKGPEAAMTRSFLSSKQSGALSITIQLEGQETQTGTFAGGKIDADTAPAIDGYRFKDAVINILGTGYNVEYAFNYGGEVFYCRTEDGTDTAIKLEPGQSILFQYEKNVTMHTIEYKTQGSDQAEGNTFDGVTSLKEGEDLTFSVSTAVGCHADVTVNGGRITGNEENFGLTSIYKVLNVKTDLTVVIDYQEIHDFSVDLSWKNEANGGKKYLHDASVTSDKSTFRPGDTVTWTITSSNAENVNWQLDSLQMNGEDIEVPASFGADTGEGCTTVLHNGKNAGMEVTVQYARRQGRGRRYQYTHVVTIKNARTNIKLTYSNLRAATWAEVMPVDIVGVNAQVHFKSDNQGWDRVMPANPIGQNDSYYPGKMEFRYQVLNGYGNASVTVDGERITPIKKGGYYYFDFDRSGNRDEVKLKKLSIVAQKINFSVGYDLNGGEENPSFTDNNKYDVTNRPTIYIKPQIPVKDGYYFQGWRIKGDTSKTIYQPGTTVNINQLSLGEMKESEGITFISQWAAEDQEGIYVPYKVIYKLQDDDGNYIEDTKLSRMKSAIIGSTVFQLDYDNTIERDGKTYKINTGHSTFVSRIEKGGQEAILLCYDKCYAVKYNGNGNDGGVVPKDHTLYSANDRSVVLKGEPTRAGYTFEGWDLSGNIYKAGETFTIPRADVTLNARWSRTMDDVTVQPYDRKYDGKPHSVAVSGNIADDDIEYSADGSHWQHTPLVYQNVVKSGAGAAGQYPVQVRISNSGHSTIIQSFVKIQPRSVEIETSSAKKEYDGKPLKRNSIDSDLKVTGDGFIAGEGADYTITGSQLDAGESKNRVSYELKENTLPDNYQINIKEGNLTVTVKSQAILITAGSASKAYDGKPLEDAAYTYTDNVLADGEKLTAVVEGSQTNAGKSVNKVASYEVMSSDGRNVTENYSFQTSVNGLLTVQKRAVTLTSGDANKAYDGKALTEEAVTAGAEGFADGEGVSCNVTGSQTDAGETDNTFTYKWNSNTNQDNYNITVKKGRLSVSKRAITITGQSAEKPYDGIPLIAGYQLSKETPLADGELLKSAEVNGSQLYMGTSANVVNGAVILRGSHKVTDNYNITYQPGTLTVTANTHQIIITADSAHKLYNGTPLTDRGYSFTQNVLSKGDVLTASVEGSQTDAGSSVNKVASYKVMRGTWDVTANYTFGDSIDGTLTVDKRTVTLKSADAKKEYDGKPLKSNKVEVKGDGFADGEGVSTEVTGSRLDAGKSGNTFTYTWMDGTKADNYAMKEAVGNLEVTPVAAEIVITAVSGSRQYNGEAFKNAGYTYTDKVLRDGDKLTAAVKGSQTDAGSSANKVVSQMVMRGDKDITGNYTFGKAVEGKLTVYARELTLVSGSSTQVYNGTPLKNQAVSAEGGGFVLSDGARYQVTGSRLDAGSSKNTFTYTLKKGTKSGNYHITKREGELTVTPITTEIVIKADSSSRKYDGGALTDKGYTYTGGILINGDKLTAAVKGSQTDAGSSANRVTSYKAVRGDEDVTGNYTFGEVRNGTLEVRKRTVKLTSANDSKIYDGTALKNNHVDQGGDGFVPGEGASEDVTGSQLYAGTSDNVFTYKLKEGTQAGNYDITSLYGELKVSPVPTKIVISANSQTREYNGSALTDSGYSFTENVLKKGDELTAVVEGSQTDAGSAANKVISYKVMHGEVDVAGSYTFAVPEDGTLTVNPRNVKLISAGGTKEYDGAVIENDKVAVKGDGFSEGEGASFNVTGSQLDAGSSKNTFTYTLNEGTKAGNYRITTSEGTLNVSRRGLAITADSAGRPYNGTALTKNSFTSDGLVNGEAIESVKIEGSRTDPGTSDNIASAAVVKSGDKDVTGNYDIAYVKGKLTVTANENTIVITADSAGKKYDGAPLENKGYTYTQDVLAEGDVLSADVKGSRTDAGSSVNKVASYKVMRGTRDVTSNYTFGDSIDGALTVDKRTVTLTSFDDSKIYDGAALKNNAVEEGGDKFISGEGATIDVTGNQLDAGSSKNTFTYTLNKGTKAGNYDITVKEGKLTVTPAEVKIVITAGSASKVYDKAPLKDTSYTYTQNVLVKGDMLTAVTKGSQTDAGSSRNEVASYKVVRGGKNVTGNYTFGEPKNGILTVGKRFVELTSGDAGRTYNAKALTNAVVTAGRDGFADGDGAAYNVTGSRLDAGISDNTFTYKLKKGTNPKNYSIHTVFGKLEVTPVPTEIVITANSAGKLYNGTALTDNGFTYTDSVLVSNDKLTAVIDGSRTDAGSSKNHVASYRVKRGEKDVTGNYTFGEARDGILTVNKRHVELISEGAAKIYDGKALQNDVVKAGGDGFPKGEGASCFVTGSQLDAGDSRNTFTYALNGGTRAKNYSITTTEGILSVGRKELSITAGSAGKPYDGKALTENSYTSEGLAEGDFIESVQVKGSRLDPGTSDNTAGAATVKRGGQDVADNYDITYIGGKLTVTANKNTIVITAGSSRKKYDGTPLKNAGFTFTQDVLAEGDVLTADVKGGRTDAGSSVNKVASYKVMRGTWDVTSNYTFGDSIDGALTVDKRTVTLNSSDGSKAYDGTALKNNTIEIGGDGFVNKEGAAIDVTGNQLDAGNSKNTFTYTLNKGTKAGNYTITANEGQLTVTPITAQIIITAANDVKTYDGTPLTNGHYTYTNGILVNGDKLTVTVEGAQTNAGVSSNVAAGFKVMRGTADVTKNYTFGTAAAGKLEVTKRPITITAGSAQKIYDGTPLVKNTSTAEEGALLPMHTCTATVRGTQTDAGTSDNLVNGAVITSRISGENVTANYDITYVKGTLTVSPGNTPGETPGSTPGNSTYALVIHYVDTTGAVIAPDYFNEYKAGTQFSIQSPSIAGYTPNYASISSGEKGMPQKALEFSVVYTADPQITAIMPQTAAPSVPGTIQTVSTPMAPTPVTPPSTAAVPKNAAISQNKDGEYKLTPIKDAQAPLANKKLDNHKCCILHFLLMLLALIVLLFYTRSMKKQKARILELKEKLLIEKRRGLDEEENNAKS